MDDQRLPKKMLNLEVFGKKKRTSKKILRENEAWREREREREEFRGE